MVVSIRRKRVSHLVIPQVTDNCCEKCILIFWQIYLFVFLRLMVNLTQPAVLCFGNNIPDDKTGQHYYLDIVTQLQSYKEVTYTHYCYIKSRLTDL